MDLALKSVRNRKIKRECVQYSLTTAEGSRAVIWVLGHRRHLAEMACRADANMAIYNVRARLQLVEEETKKQPRTQQFKEQQGKKRSHREEPTATTIIQSRHRRDSSRIKPDATVYSPNPGGGTTQVLGPVGLRH